MILFE
ncbi:hypothetical protein CP03DC29_0681A, partial [Chlamydia psittaci 03DC29]|jgi:hypothetical protein